jgi:hypothetical protein
MRKFIEFKSNCTYSDSVLKRTVVNNSYSARSVSLGICTIIRKPLFLIMEALHSTEDTVYIYQNMQDFYPLILSIYITILNCLCLFWEFISVTLSLTGFWWGSLREVDHSGDPYVNGRITLRWIFGKWEGIVETGWSGLRIGTGGGHL